MKNISFNSKETYLAYRSSWKAEYKILSHEIRLLRLATRHFQRGQHSHLSLSEREQRCLAEAAKLCGLPNFQAATADYERRRRSARATATLAELKEAKLEAQRQYLARKAAEEETRRP